MAPTIYMIVLMDNASDNYTYGVFEHEDLRNTVYSSVDAAKAVMTTMAENFDEFMPTAYGKAFPYEATTFEQELSKKFFAPLGWGVIRSEDGVQRICLGLLAREVR